ncbi:hypothetical protein F5B18DRAFT_650705 [Nemania serpens]|nr:hypothetical protein F5B18DRAFT_650705 [Nemania serpens]
MPQYRDVQGTKDRGATGDGHWPRGGSIPTTRHMKPAVLNQRTQGPQTKPSPSTPARKLRDPPVPTSTRKISASFSTDCPLSGHPTTAYSAVIASTGIKYPGPLTSHPVRQSTALPSSQSYGNIRPSIKGRGLKASHTYSNLPLPAAQCKASLAKPHLINQPSALPSSQSYGNIRTSKIGRGLKASHAYGNLPVPAAGYKVSPAKSPLLVTAHAASRAVPNRNAENIPPSISMGNMTMNKQTKSACPTPRLISKPPSPKKAKSRPGLPKSRTFNMFSNLTASFSRTSLSQLTGSDSRRASIASKGAARNNPTPYMSSQSASSTSSQVLPNSAVDTTDPRLIHKGQSSAYWTGRFMALQDRFQSETLMPENLATLVHTHAERSLLPVAKPSLASSATMGCIPPAVKTDLLTRAANKSTTPGKSQQQRRQQVNRVAAAPKALRSTPTTASAQPSYATTAALLIDEDNRCRRIFSHLDALCTTSEARTSLRQWQQSYARRVGKESLLPEGGTMQGRTRELTWVGRLLIGSGSGHTKRGGL